MPLFSKISLTYTLYASLFKKRISFFNFVNLHNSFVFQYLLKESKLRLYTIFCERRYVCFSN